jgi:Zn-dependent protease with chaperone function
MNVDGAVKSLAILAAIPVTLLAIWADYYGRTLAETAKDNPHYDRGPELYKIRIAGICAIFFQLGIYMGTTEIRDAAPVLSNAIFIAAVLIQSWIQSSTERKVRKPSPSLKPIVDSNGLMRDANAPDPEGDTPRIEPRPRWNVSSSELGTNSRQGSASPGGPAPGPGEREPIAEMDLALRAFFWATLGGALYLAGFAVPVLAVGFCSRFLGLSQEAMAAVVVVSAIGGMLGGVAINFALGAVYLKRMLPTSELPEGGLRADIEACFGKAGLPLPSLWVIETGRRREAIAMMAGFGRGRGIFRPGLFVSRALLEALTEPEVRAVVLHEVAHLRLSHLRKRMLYSVGLVVALTAAATFCVFLAMVSLPKSDAHGLIGIAAAMAAFGITFKLLGAQSRQHELAADACAVGELGAGVEDLISALRKLDKVNGRAPVMIGHPATDLRVEALKARFAKANSDSAPDERPDSGDSSGESGNRAA